MKYKLLLIVEAIGGGVRRHIVDLIRGLSHQQFDITLLYGTSRADETFQELLFTLQEKAEIIPCDSLVREINPKQDMRALSEIKTVIRQIHPDIVHCHSSKAGILGRLAAKQMKVPKVFYTPHAYSFQAPEFAGCKKQVFTFLERWFSKHATTLTFNVSGGEKQAALGAKLDRPEKFKVIYNGIPDIPLLSKETARAALGLPFDVPVVGVIARLNEQKDPFTFCKIAKKVLSVHPDVQFAYIGDGPLQDAVQQWIRRQNIQQQVHLLGYRKDAEMLVSGFDGYLLTSLYEGMPYSLVEAIRAGVSVAATRTVGNDEVVQPGENGLLFPVGDAEQGAKSVLQLLDNPFPTEQVQASYRRRYTIEGMLSQIESYYQRGDT